jgi:ATP synthase protein I
MVVSTLLTGTKGLIGAALGTALVMVFFTAGQVAISWSASHIPQFLMPAAMATYLLQLVVVGAATMLLREVDVFTPRAFGFTALACTLVWMAAQIRGVVKTKMLYVESDGASEPESKDRVS